MPHSKPLQHHRAHLQQRQTDGAQRRLGQLGRLQGHAAQPFDQRLREAAQKEAGLVDVKVARRRRVGEQPSCWSLIRFSISPQTQYRPS